MAARNRSTSALKAVPPPATTEQVDPDTVPGTVMVTAKKAAPAKKAAVKTEPEALLVAKPKKAAAPKPERAPFTVPAGYIVRWPHVSYDLLAKVDKKAEGSPWIVVCNQHGTTTPAKNGSEGDQLGGAKGRKLWCPAEA